MLHLVSHNVELVVIKKAENSLTEIIPVNKRIMVALFDGNPKTSLVIDYAPVEGSEEAEDHLNLSNTINGIPKHRNNGTLPKFSRKRTSNRSITRHRPTRHY